MSPEANPQQYPAQPNRPPETTEGSASHSQRRNTVSATIARFFSRNQRHSSPTTDQDGSLRFPITAADVDDTPTERIYPFSDPPTTPDIPTIPAPLGLEVKEKRDLPFSHIAKELFEKTTPWDKKQSKLDETRKKIDALRSKPTAYGAGIDDMETTLSGLERSADAQTSQVLKSKYKGKVVEKMSQSDIEALPARMAQLRNQISTIGKNYSEAVIEEFTSKSFEEMIANKSPSLKSAYRQKFAEVAACRREIEQCQMILATRAGERFYTSDQAKQLDKIYKSLNNRLVEANADKQQHLHTERQQQMMTPEERALQTLQSEIMPIFPQYFDTSWLIDTVKAIDAKFDQAKKGRPMSPDDREKLKQRVIDDSIKGIMPRGKSPEISKLYYCLNQIVSKNIR